MLGVSLGEFFTVLSVLAGVLGSLTVFHRALKRLLDSVFDKHLKEISQQVDKLEMTSAKNFIIVCLAKLEKDVRLTEMERQRFWEAVQEYHRQGGNGYVDSEIRLYKELGKL